MKKSFLVLLSLLFTGIVFSQTTVTLQDQCNCEVLKGTQVTTPGMSIPTGADIGDIYVNTNTGTIYFWDGNSWELTSTDNQQLTGFNFDGISNTLTLTLENGGSVNVDLSSLSDTLTDTNTTIASYGIDSGNSNLVITDSEGNTFSIALADLGALIDTNTDEQTLTLTGTDLSISGGNSIDISPIDTNTDEQTLTLTGTDLEISGGNTIDISGVNTDDQTLTLTDNTLSLEDGGSVDLEKYLDNTDERSEERRVGKECRARGAGSQCQRDTDVGSDAADNVYDVSRDA